MLSPILRPLVKYWRMQGLRVIIYLDDGIFAVSGKQAARDVSDKVRKILPKRALWKMLVKSLASIVKADLAWL